MVSGLPRLFSVFLPVRVFVLDPSSFDKLRMRSNEKILMLSLSKHELVEGRSAS
jgi:hypothetical protein